MFSIFVCTVIFVCTILSCSTKTAAKIYEETDTNLYKEQVTSIEVFNKNVAITNSDLRLMAQVVYGESRAEPYEGKVAVASVILNRLKHPEFPKTIKDVILQKDAFSCISGGIIGVEPDSSSYNAVMEALKGKDPSGNAVFFYNPKTATSPWMKRVQKTNEKAIGNHIFFYVR